MFVQVRRYYIHPAQIIANLAQVAQADALSPQSASFADSARDGWAFYQSLQLPDGHWACGYGGPSFLLPGLIFAMYITQYPIPSEWACEMIRYLHTHVNDDGGWGLHLEGPSTVLATTRVHQAYFRMNIRDWIATHYCLRE